jgi:hypothetical protein
VAWEKKLISDLFICGLFDDVSTITGCRVKNDLEGLLQGNGLIWDSLLS